MPDKQISDFAVMADAQDNDLLLISSNGETYTLKVRSLREAVNSDISRMEATVAEARRVITDLQDEYSGTKFTVLSHGAIGTEEPITSDISYDLKGNLLLLDTATDGGKNTKVSFDNGATWSALTIPSSVTGKFLACCGNDKIMCLTSNKLMWVSLGSGTPAVTVNSHSAVLPGVVRCKGANGKYFVIRTSTDSQAYMPLVFSGQNAYFTEAKISSGSLLYAARDIAYDDNAGVYYVAGFSYSSGSTGRNKATVYWSSDLTAWQEYVSVDCENAADCLISVRNGAVNLYLHLNSGAISCYQYAADGTVERAITTEEVFTHPQLASLPSVDLIASDNKPCFAFYQDGTYREVSNDLIVPVSEAGTGNIKMSTCGMYFAIANAGAWAVGRWDFLTEQLAEHIKDQALHFTSAEKEFLSRPYSIYVHRGTGNMSYTIKSLPGGKEPRLILAMCQEFPPCTVGADGSLNVYWDFWMKAGSSTSYGGGGITVDAANNSFTMKNRVKPAGSWYPCTRNLNENGKIYVLLFFYDPPTA